MTAPGDLTGSNDEAQAVYGYSYDSSHRLTKVVNPDQNATTIAYDGQGRVSSVTRVTDPATGAGAHDDVLLGPELGLLTPAAK